jgi:hypothetical protein
MSNTIISYHLLLITVLGIGFIRYKKLTIPFKILTLSVIATLLLAILNQISINRYKHNYPILHLECITGYIFYSLSYYYLFKDKKLKKLILISIVIVTVFFFINAIFLQPFNKVFPSNLYLPTQALFALFSLLLFREMLQYPLKINIIKQSVFWYNTAILFYATTMFFMLGLTNYFGEHKFSINFVFFIGYFWYFILFVFHILIGVSFLTSNKEITTTDA